MSSFLRPRPSPAMLAYQKLRRGGAAHLQASETAPEEDDVLPKVKTEPPPPALPRPPVATQPPQPAQSGQQVPMAQPKQPSLPVAAPQQTVPPRPPVAAAPAAMKWNSALKGSVPTNEVQTMEQKGVATLPGVKTLEQKGVFMPPTAGRDDLVKRYTTPEDTQQAQDFKDGIIPSSNTKNHTYVMLPRGGGPVQAQQADGRQSTPSGQLTAQSTLPKAGTAQSTPPRSESTVPAPAPALIRAEVASAGQLEEAKQHGAVIQDDKTVPHPDGQGGLLHQTGFALKGFRETDEGTTIPYRDDHGKQYPIPAQDMRRVTDSNGKVNYHFNVNGKPVSVPEDSQAPLFKVDASTGKRFIHAEDGSLREAGVDRNTAAAVAVPLHEQAAQGASEKKLAEGAALTRQLQDTQAQAAAAKQRVADAHQAVTAANQTSGPDSQTQRIRAMEEGIAAEESHKSLTQKVQDLQTQSDAHYRSLVNDQRARGAVTNEVRSAAVESPTDAPWQKDSRSLQGDPRATDAKLIAAAGKSDPAHVEAIGKAQVSAPTKRVFDAAGKAFGGAGGQPGAPAAEGQSMSLHEMLMQAPEMKQGKGTREVKVDQAKAAQATAAQATAEDTLGIDDPKNVRVTRGADGGYNLSRPAADGSGPGQPFATLDAKSNRITLIPGADGKLSQEAQDMAAKGSPNGTPIYHPGGQPPLSTVEVGDLINKGVQATGSATDRKQADAALTQAGLSPEGIDGMVKQGRLSVQDGKLLNDKFNSGVNSYAERQAGEAAQKQDTELQQMQQEGNGTKDKPIFKSWLDKGDPQRDAQVQAKAKELGVSEDEVRRDLETRRAMDFNTPLTQESHDQQSGMVNGLKRGLGLGGQAETTRTLPDGSILPNPELGNDRAKFDAAIAASGGTPEAKAKAQGLWEKYHDNYLNNTRSTLETMPKLPGVENYMAWRGRMQEKGDFNNLSENQKAEQYMKEQKGRPWYRKLADNVGSNLLAGSHDLVAGIAGAGGLLTGSKTLSDFAAEKAGDAERTTAALQHTGNDGAVNNVIGGVARAVPGVVAAVATGGTAGAAAMSVAQGSGNAFADAYKYHTDQGMSPEAAHKAAAGTAIAVGAVSAVADKIFPGGAKMLNNPATREVARKSFGTAMKTLFKKAGKEVTEEALNNGFSHIITEVGKGKTVQEAAASYMEQLPESVAIGHAVGAAQHLGGGGSGATGGAAAVLPLHGGGAAQPPPTAASHGQTAATSATVQTEHVDQGAHAPLSGPPPIMTASVDGPDEPLTPHGSGAHITPTGVEGGVVPGQSAAPSVQQQIPLNTTKDDQASPTHLAPELPAKLENAGKVHDRIAALQEKKQGGSLSPGEALELHHSENIVALTQAHNLEQEQRVLGSLTKPRELDPVKTQALADAKAVLARPDPGQSPPSSSSGSGTTPPASNAATGSPPAPPAAKPTAPPQIGHGRLIPEDTTSPEHIDLARRRAANLGEAAAAGKLNPHEQSVYDNARRVLDRNAPAQGGTRDGSPSEGSRNNGNPQDVVMAGGDPSQGHGAAAEAPPTAAPAQAPHAIGATIQGPGAASPDVPTAAAGDQQPPPSAPPPSAPPPSAPPPSAPSYPPIDHDHIIKADFNNSGKPTGGHSLVNGDVEIIAGIESHPNVQGVYEAHVHMKNANGRWVTKESNAGVNTMFPKDWSAEKIKAEVGAAWNSPSKSISPDGKTWRSTTPSGVVLRGYINHNRITAYPIY
jgi:hypothetical protein